MPDDASYRYPPRGLNRIEACRYLGMALPVFDALVAAGALPPPKLAGKRHIWDRIALEVAFSGLPDAEADGRSSLEKLIDSRRL